MLAIKTQGLAKQFGPKKVLHGIDLEVATGKRVGFLGPNGAGKSTTIRILMGLIQATAGTATLLGRDAFRRGREARNKIGYLPGEVNLYKSMTGLATIAYTSRVRKIDCVSQAKQLAQRLDLDLHLKVSKFSSGMKQKLGLILAVMHDPDLLVLDEPTSALDPLIKKTVSDLLREFSDRGKTVLFSSHTLNEVEDLCDEVIILRSGRIVEHQSISRLKDMAVRRVILEMNPNVPTPQDPHFNFRKQQGREVHGTWSGSPAGLLDFLQTTQVSNFVVERPDLEDLFMTYYSEFKSENSTSENPNKEKFAVEASSSSETDEVDQ